MDVANDLEDFVFEKCFGSIIAQKTEASSEQLGFGYL